MLVGSRDGKGLGQVEDRNTISLALFTRFDFQGMPLSGYLGKDDAPTWMQEDGRDGASGLRPFCN